MLRHLSLSARRHFHNRIRIKWTTITCRAVQAHSHDFKYVNYFKLCTPHEISWLESSGDDTLVDSYMDIAFDKKYRVQNYENKQVESRWPDIYLHFSTSANRSTEPNAFGSTKRSYVMPDQNEMCALAVHTFLFQLMPDPTPLHPKQSERKSASRYEWIDVGWLFGHPNEICLQHTRTEINIMNGSPRKRCVCVCVRVRYNRRIDVCKH